MAVQRTCALCGGPIDPLSSYVWHGVHGWERKAQAASRKSGSDIALRRALDEFAHDHCVSLAKDGLAPTQGALV